MPNVLEINQPDQLVHYRLLWNALLSQTRHATFFHTLDWLETYWRHFGRDQKLRVLVVSYGEEPIGILPLVVRTEPTRVGKIRVLTYPVHDWGSFYGPIGPNPTATLMAGMAHVHHTRRDWDLLDLRYVDTGVDHGRTATAMRFAGFRPCQQNWSQVAMIDLEGTWDTYWMSRSKKWRDNVGRGQRRLAELGKVTYLRYRPEGKACGDGDPRWDLYDASIQVAERSWQGTSTTGTTLCHPGIRQYLRDTHAVATALGDLDLNLLLVDDRPVAFSYNYFHDGWISGLRMGFDPEFAPCSPGSVLQAMILEDSFRRGDHTYDMGVGSLECKEHWQTSLVYSHRYTHFPAAAPRAGLLRAKRWLQDHLWGSDYVQYQVK